MCVASCDANAQMLQGAQARPLSNRERTAGSQCSAIARDIHAQLCCERHPATTADMLQPNSRVQHHLCFLSWVACMSTSGTCSGLLHARLAHATLLGLTATSFALCRQMCTPAGPLPDYYKAGHQHCQHLSTVLHKCYRGLVSQA